MAQSDGADHVTVIISSTLCAEIKGQRHNRNASIGVVKSEWATSVGINLEGIFLEYNERRLSDETCLSELIGGGRTIIELTANRTQQTLTVVVDVEEQSQPHVYRLSTADSVARVKGLWAADCGLNANDVEIFSRPPGAALPDTAALGDLAGSSILELIARSVSNRLTAVVRDGPAVHPFRMSPGDPVSAVRGRWAAASGLDGSEVALLLDGAPAADATPLGSLAGADAGLMEFTVERRVTLRVRLFRSSDAGAARLRVFPSQRVADVMPALRSLLGLGPERAFRLRTAAGVVDAWRTWREAGVGADTLLDADPAFDLALTDVWDGTVTRHRLFASDPPAALLPPGPDSELLFRGRHLALAEDLLSTLLPAGGADFEAFELQLRVPRAVVVAGRRRGLRQALVLPHGRVRASLGALGARPDRELVWDGGPVAPQRRWRDMGVPDGAVLLARPLRVVLAAGKKRRTARLPRGGCVRDLVQAAAAVTAPGCRRWRLQLRGALLDDEDAELAAAGVRDGDTVRLLANGEPVTVRWAEGEWRGELGPSATFSDLVRAAATELDLSSRHLAARTLVCDGCGRRLTLDEEPHQRIPAACCRVRSLRLSQAEDDGVQIHPCRHSVASVQMPEPQPGEETSPSFPLFVESSSRDDAEVDPPGYGTSPTPPAAAASPPARAVAVDPSSLGATSRHFHDSSHQHECASGFCLTILLPEADSMEVQYAGCGDDTVEDVITFLRNRGYLTAVMDMLVGPRSLIDSPDWQKKSLKDCGLLPRDTITVFSLQCSVVRVDLHQPVERHPIGIDVEIDYGGSHWSTLVEKLEGYLNSCCIAFQKGIFYERDGMRRRAVLSWLREKDDWEYTDEMDGEIIDYDNRTDLLWHNLTPTSFIRAAPNRIPVVKVYANTNFYCLEMQDNEYSYLQIPLELLFSEEYLVFFSGLELVSPQHYHSRFMLCYDRSFFSCETGEAYDNEDHVYSRHRRFYGGNSECFRFFILLKHNDMIPKFPGDNTKSLLIYVRNGMDVRVRNGRLVCDRGRTATEEANMQLWTTSREITPLERNLTKEMRRL